MNHVLAEVVRSTNIVVEDSSDNNHTYVIKEALCYMANCEEILQS